MTIPANQLGQLLKAARQGKKLTLRAVEEQAGVSNAYLSQLESGKVRQPSPVVLHNLSQLYEISYADTMAMAGYPVPGSSGIEGRSNRLLARFGPISNEEEEALGEYLEFLRSRRGRK
jgi:HTH-type transcriptional regulator, competence development regulator